jgi:hypothetical protein
MNNRSEILRTIYSYGTPCGDHFGFFRLLRNGRLKGYSHPNEHLWNIKGNKLTFLTSDRKPTSTFTHSKKHNCWIGTVYKRRFPLYVLPVLTLPEPDKPAAFPSVFLNTLPKSGTYLLEAALKFVGLSPTNLHLHNCDEVVDWNGRRIDEIHRIDGQAIRCPHDLIPDLLNGQIVVGHVSDVPTIEAFLQHRVIVISVVRDLRSQLVANYIAAKRLGLGKSLFEQACYKMDDKQGILAFYSFHHGAALESGIDFTKAMLRTVVGGNCDVLLKYEGLRAVDINRAIFRLNNPAVLPFLKTLFAVLPEVIGRPTPTLSPTQSRWEDFWSDAFQNLFKSSGLEDLNAELGY